MLLVDGLDENDELPPIAALLPAGISQSAHILVLSRYQPPLPFEVSPDHPLRDSQLCPRITLQSSPHAKLLRQRALSDLGGLLESDLLTRHLLSLLAVGGPMSLEDAVAILSAQEYERYDVARVLRTVPARVLNVLPLTRPNRYAFAHDVLRDVTLEEIGAAAAEKSRSMLHNWAAYYANQGWRDDTPDYLLDVYPTLLSANRDTARLTNLLTPARMDLWQRRQGHAASAVGEIDLALSLLANEEVPDVGRACILALRRALLSSKVSSMRPAAAESWAVLGQWDRAYHIAASLRNSVNRDIAWASLATVAIDNADLDRAESIVTRIADPFVRCRSIARLAGAAVHTVDRITSMSS